MWFEDSEVCYKKCYAPHTHIQYIAEYYCFCFLALAVQEILLSYVIIVLLPVRVWYLRHRILLHCVATYSILILISCIARTLLLSSASSMCIVCSILGNGVGFVGVCHACVYLIYDVLVFFIWFLKVVVKFLFLEYSCRTIVPHLYVVKFPEGGK